MNDTLRLITAQTATIHNEWFWSLFMLIGFGLKIAFDKLDQNVSTDIKTEEGKKTLRSWLLGFICTAFFMTIIVVANITSHASNDYSFALYLLCYGFTGYLAPHVFLKGAALFQKKVDEKAGVTITETHTTDIKTTGNVPIETPKP